MNELSVIAMQRRLKAIYREASARADHDYDGLTPDERGYMLPSEADTVAAWAVLQQFKAEHPEIDWSKQE